MKMTRSGMFAITLTVFLAVLESGLCVKCYSCVSTSDPNCGDPFKGGKINTLDCMTQDAKNFNDAYLSLIQPSNLIRPLIVGAPKYCHKIVLQSGVVVRACLDSNPTNMNQTCAQLDIENHRMVGNTGGAIKHCSVCDKDSCNGSSAISASVPLAFLALVASYFYCKH